MPETRAACTVDSEGGNTRFSTSTDWIADVDSLMDLSPRLVNFGRYCGRWHLQATDWREAYKAHHIQPLPEGNVTPSRGCLIPRKPRWAHQPPRKAPPRP